MRTLFTNLLIGERAAKDAIAHRFVTARFQTLINVIDECVEEFVRVVLFA
jgi:hypothetical protein